MTIRLLFFLFLSRYHANRMLSFYAPGAHYASCLSALIFSFSISRSIVEFRSFITRIISVI